MTGHSLYDHKETDEGEGKAVEGAPEVSGVAYVVHIALGHIPAVKQVERGEDVAGDGDGNQVDVDAHLGLEQDGGEQDG